MLIRLCCFTYCHFAYVVFLTPLLLTQPNLTRPNQPPNLTLQGYLTLTIAVSSLGETTEGEMS